LLLVFSHGVEHTRIELVTFRLPVDKIPLIHRQLQATCNFLYLLLYYSIPQR
jgi:hypothetical protein